MRWKQNKLKLNKGQYIFNLFRLIQITVMFAVSNLFSYCIAACPGGATFSTESISISTTAGAISHKLTNRGYSLKQSRIWKSTSSVADANIYGFELTYSADCCGDPDIVHMYGSRTGIFVWSVSITQKVKAVKFMTISIYLRDIGFTLEDCSLVQTCNCATCTKGTTISLSSNQSLVGLATRQLSGSPFMLDALNPDLSIWIDNVAPYSECISPGTLSFMTTIVNKIYYVTSPQVTTEVFETNLEVLSPTYTFAYKKNGVTIASSPAWLSYVENSRQFMYSIPSDFSQVGTYIVYVTATQDIQTTNFCFDISVMHICNTTTFSAQTVNNMNYQIAAAAATQITPFPNTIATDQSNPNYCGANIFSFSPSKTFLTGSGNVISVSTSNPADVGTHSNITVRVSLQNYPLVLSISRTFTVTISCVVQTLTFQTFLASTTLQVGIDAQPKDIVFSTSQNPACGKTVTFSLSPTLSFLSLQDLTYQECNFRINGAIIANHNTYAQVLSATVDGETATANFDVIIKDPCQTAVFETTPAGLINMTINMPSSATQTQTVVIKTDVELVYPPIVCPFTVTSLTPSAAFIILTANTISVNAVLIQLPTDLGIHTFTITVVSSNFPGTVLSGTYNFNVTITCAVSSLTITSQVVDTTYTLNQGTLVTAAFTVVQDYVCNYAFTYAFTFSKNGSSISQPTWLSWNNNDRTFSMTITSPTDAGIYIVTSTATIPQNAENSNTVLSQNYSFMLRVQSDCVDTVISDLIVRDMITKVSQTQDVQSVISNNSIATLHNDAAYCGATTFTFVPTLPSFLQHVGNNLILSSTDPSQTDFYNFQITIGLQDFPLISPLIKFFKATIQCEVITITAVPNAIANQKYRIFIDSPINVPFQFTEIPQCGLTMTYNVQPASYSFQVVQSSSPDQITITSQSLNDSGSYRMTIEATPLRTANLLQPKNQLYLGNPLILDFTLEMINICQKTKFFKQPIPNIEILRQSSSYRNTQYLPFSEFVYEAKLIQNLECGKLSKALNLSKTNQRAPDWMSVQDQRIAINFESLTQTYNQAIDLFVSLEEYPFINTTSTFNVTLSDAEIRCFDGILQIYEIKSIPLSFGVQFQNKTSVSNIKLTSIQEVIAFKSDQEIQLPSFVQVDKLSKIFTIDGGQLEDIGSYKIGWRLGYAEYPESQVFCTSPVQVRNVTSFIEETIPESTTDQQKSTFQVSSQNITQKTSKVSLLPQSQIKPFIKETTQKGKVMIVFSSDINIVLNLQMNNNGTIFLDQLNLTRDLQSEINPKNIKNERIPVLEVNVIPGIESNAADLEFVWNVTKQSSKTMEIQLYFKTPLKVSQNLFPDVFELKFCDPSLFTGTERLKMKQEMQVLRKTLPPQMAHEGFQVEFATVLDNLSQSTKSLAIGNFILNIWMSASLNLLWSMINTQQLIVLMPCFCVQMPANAQFFFNQINEIASFDMIDTNPLINRILKLNSTEPMNANFNAIGFESMYFLNNMGSLIIGFLIYFFGLIAILCLQPFLNRKTWINKSFIKLKKMLLYDSIISMMMESYSLICVCCLIAFYEISFKSYGEIVQTVFNFFFFGLIFIFPAILIYSINKHWEPKPEEIIYDQNNITKAMLTEIFRENNSNWRNMFIKQRYSALFEELSMEYGPIVLIHPCFFMLRRLIMAVIVVIFRNFFWMQLFLTAISNIAAVILIGYADFFENPQKRKMEIANEILVMSMLYCVVCFSPFVPEIETRFKIGYFCCIVEALALAGNFWLIMSSTIRVMIQKVKVWFSKQHKAKWRPTHLRKRAKGRVLRKRRNKERAKVKGYQRYEEEEGEQDREEISQPATKQKKTKNNRTKLRLHSNSKSKKKIAIKLEQIKEEENENNSGSEESDIRKSLANKKINFNAFLGVNGVIEGQKRKIELPHAEKIVKNQILKNQCKMEKQAFDQNKQLFSAQSIVQTNSYGDEKIENDEEKKQNLIFQSRRTKTRQNRKLSQLEAKAKEEKLEEQLKKEVKLNPSKPNQVQQSYLEKRAEHLDAHKFKKRKDSKEQAHKLVSKVQEKFKNEEKTEQASSGDYQFDKEFFSFVNQVDKGSERDFQSVWKKVELLPSYRQASSSQKQVNQFLELPQTSLLKTNKDSIPQKLIQKAKNLFEQPVEKPNVQFQKPNQSENSQHSQMRIEPLFYQDDKLYNNTKTVSLYRFIKSQLDNKQIAQNQKIATCQKSQPSMFTHTAKDMFQLRKQTKIVQNQAQQKKKTDFLPRQNTIILPQPTQNNRNDMHDFVATSFPKLQIIEETKIHSSSPRGEYKQINQIHNRAKHIYRPYTNKLSAIAINTAYNQESHYKSYQIGQNHYQLDETSQKNKPQLGDRPQEIAQWYRKLI